MSQHIQQQHHPQPHYVHYTPPTAHPFTHVAPKDTQHQPLNQSQPQQQPPPQPQQQPQPQAAQGSGTSAPLVATGDWTKDLVHLAKTAELKCVFIIDISPVVPVSSIFRSLHCRPTLSVYHRTNLYPLISENMPLHCNYIPHISYLLMLV